MNKKTVLWVFAWPLFLGLLTFRPSAQADDSPSIEKSCLFFNKIIFHLTENLTTSSGFVLKQDEIREFILSANYKTPLNVTQALITGLCGNNPSCPHTKSNTVIDHVEFSADCDDNAIRKIIGSTSR